MRRLSQGSGGTSVTSHGSGQWPQRRKFSGKMQFLKIYAHCGLVKPSSWELQVMYM